jgi:hypothetical protein
MTTNFKTENSTFRKLTGNGVSYQVPRFQRDYSWTAEEWEDLWEDIHETLSAPDRTAHYMGYLVLQSTDDKTFDVIDGQQRLTTLSIFILAVLKNMQRLIDAGTDAVANKRRKEQITQTYIGYLDPVTLVARPKLVLNRNNNAYYQNHLVPLGHLPVRGFRASEHLLRKAFEWFDNRVAEDLNKNTGEPGRYLAKLVEDISDRLFFTVTTVTDELNAYKVFETLNVRGVQLSATDLLKNFLFSVLDGGAEAAGHNVRNLEERWEAVVDRLQSENFPQFLRDHWNSRHIFVRQSDLFKTIRAKVNTPQNVFQLLREMEEDLDTFLALSSPEVPDWSQENKNCVRLLHLLRLHQPFSLLLAGRRVFSSADFSGLLRAIVTISMRYNVICSHSTGDQERKYNQISERIAKNELTHLPPALQAMRSIYPDDASFRAAFSEKTIRTKDSRNNRIVRFILCALEKNISGKDYDFSSSAYNIEHVLPQNAPDGWGGLGHDDAEALIYRLGNMTLLQAGPNKDLGTVVYAQKRDVYRQSGFATTNRLAEHYTDWTAASIASQQKWMAKQAATVWRIAQLS